MNKRFKKRRVRFLSLSVVLGLLLLLVMQGLLFMEFRKMLELPDLVRKIINNVSLVLGIWLGTSLLLRMTISRVFNWFEEAEERIFYTKIYSWTVYTVGALVLLHNSGVSLGNITLFIGLLATGLAFAIREVLLSFFGWMIVLRKKPFRIGDYIRIGDEEGKVLHIGTFYVHLDKTENIRDDYTRVPNRFFLEKSISVLGKSRLHDQLRVQLSALPTQHREVVRELTEAISVLFKQEEKEHLLVYTDVQQDKLFLIVEFLVAFEQRKELRSALLELILERFKDFIIYPK